MECQRQIDMIEAQLKVLQLPATAVYCGEEPKSVRSCVLKHFRTKGDVVMTTWSIDCNEDDNNVKITRY